MSGTLIRAVQHKGHNSRNTYQSAKHIQKREKTSITWLRSYNKYTTCTYKFSIAHIGLHVKKKRYSRYCSQIPCTGYRITTLNNLENEKSES